jgi:hypothetical protein
MISEYMYNVQNVQVDATTLEDIRNCIGEKAAERSSSPAAPQYSTRKDASTSMNVVQFFAT